MTDPNLTKFANVTITTDPTGTFTVPAGRRRFTFPSGTTTINTGTVLDQGDGKRPGQATLDVEGGLTINGQGGLRHPRARPSMSAATSWATPPTPPGFDVRGDRVFDGNGTGSSPQLLEAMSEDSETCGRLQPELRLRNARATHQHLRRTRDESANSPGNTPNAVYVNTLIVPSGATLNLNGLHLYAQNRADQRNDHRWYGITADRRVDFDDQRELECRQQLEHGHRSRRRMTT